MGLAAGLALVVLLSIFECVNNQPVLWVVFHGLVFDLRYAYSYDLVDLPPLFSCVIQRAVIVVLTSLYFARPEFVH